METKVTSFGNPEWEKTHEKALKIASVLEALKEGGATCIGKTVIDDLGFRKAVVLFLADRLKSVSAVSHV